MILFVCKKIIIEIRNILCILELKFEFMNEKLKLSNGLPIYVPVDDESKEVAFWSLKTKSISIGITYLITVIFE